MEYGFVCPEWAKNKWNPQECAIYPISHISGASGFQVVDDFLFVTVYRALTRKECEDWLAGARNLGPELVNNAWSKETDEEFQEWSKRNLEQAEREYSMQGSYDKNLPPLFPSQDEQDDPEVGVKLSELLELRTTVANLYQDVTKLREEAIRGQFALMKEQKKEASLRNGYDKQIDFVRKQRDDVTEELRQERNKRNDLQKEVHYLQQEMDRLNRRVQELSGEVVQAKRTVMQTPGSFIVKLMDVGANKITAIKGLRVAREIGLKEAKDLVESAPVILAYGVSWDAAQALIKEMTPTQESDIYPQYASPQFVVTKIR